MSTIAMAKSAQHMYGAGFNYAVRLFGQLLTHSGGTAV